VLLTYFKLFLLLSSSEVSFCLYPLSAMHFVGKQALIISWFPFYLVICFWSIIMNRHLAGHMLTIGTTHGSSCMCTGYAPLLGPCLLDGSLGRCSYHRHLSRRPKKHDKIQACIVYSHHSVVDADLKKSANRGRSNKLLCCIWSPQLPTNWVLCSVTYFSSIIYVYW
jgi:transcription elongation factor Elf1